VATLALGISATKFLAAQATFNQANRAASVPFETYDVLLSPFMLLVLAVRPSGISGGWEFPMPSFLRRS